MIVLEVFLFVFNCSTQCVSVCVRFILSFFFCILLNPSPVAALSFSRCHSMPVTLKTISFKLFRRWVFLPFFLSFSICLSEKFHSSYCQRLCFFARSLSLSLYFSTVRLPFGHFFCYTLLCPFGTFDWKWTNQLTWRLQSFTMQYRENLKPITIFHCRQKW